jgi:hypothetical protein
MLMLGREIELPVDLIYGPHPQSEEFPEQYELFIPIFLVLANILTEYVF